jgi:Ca-activated chloride channel family protein
MSATSRSTMIPEPTVPSSGGRLVSSDGRDLPYRGCSLRVDAKGGLARVVVRQRFVNDSDQALQVTYQLSLPADAAVGGYAFEIGERRVVGRIERRDEARAQFEDAVIDGKTAALLEQERSSLFTQNIGNVPPHTVVLCELTLDQPLRWLADGQWEWRFPTVVAPRYMGAPGRVEDAAAVSVDMVTTETAPRASFNLSIRDNAVLGEPTSPSHPLAFGKTTSSLDVVLADEDGAALDRDITVRWRVPAAETGVSIDLARPAADTAISDRTYGLLTITPPLQFDAAETIARDVIFLIDTSGSMHGEPLDKAKAIVCEIIDSLTDRDRIELIEFSMVATRWNDKPQAADAETKAEATSWVRSLRAGGGTEMQSGLIAALEPLRDDAQRQVILVTDGLVGFEGEMVRTVQDQLPRGCRVHSIGVGSATNRSLTEEVARAGRGREFTVDLNEDARMAAKRVVVQMSAPLLVDLRVRGSAVAETAATAADLTCGVPVLVPIALNPEGGEVIIEGRLQRGPWVERVYVTALEMGRGSQSITRLFGREKVKMLELRAAGGREIEEEIETVGMSFGIATRLTSWIAISEEQTVDPTEPIRRVKIPQQLPAGMSVDGMGLRPARLYAGPDEIVDACLKPALGTVDPRRPRPLGRYRQRARAGSEGPARPAVKDLYEHIPDLEQADAAGIEAERAEFDDLRPPRAVRGGGASMGRGRLPVVHGTLISLRNGRIVVEFNSDMSLDWRPVEVRLVRDGSEARWPINLDATTRAGSYKPGQRVRLVVDGLPPSLGLWDVRFIDVHSDDETACLRIMVFKS